MGPGRLSVDTLTTAVGLTRGAGNLAGSVCTNFTGVTGDATFPTVGAIGLGVCTQSFAQRLGGRAGDDTTTSVADLT